MNLCFMNYSRKSFSQKPKKQKSFKFHNVDTLLNQYRYYSLNGRMVYCNSWGRLQLLSSSFCMQCGERK